VAIGNARIPVPVSDLDKPTVSAPVDLFVRCERLQITTDRPIACTGRIAALIYQGGHVDAHVETAAAVAGKVLLRLPGDDTMSKWRVGETVNMAIDGTDAVAFSTGENETKSKPEANAP
jgi:hypothetical protein